MDEPTQTGSERRTEPAPGRASLPCWWLPVALGIYILSIGPAARISVAHPATRAALQTIYTPITAFCRAFPPAGRVLEWYTIAVWKVRDN